MESDNINEDNPDGGLQHVFGELGEGEDGGRLIKSSIISQVCK